MNNKQKGLTAASIFLFLCFSGWYANEWNKRMIHDKGLDRPDSYEIQGVDDGEIPQAVPFKPREYIRIGNRMAN